MDGRKGPLQIQAEAHMTRMHEYLKRYAATIAEPRNRQTKVVDDVDLMWALVCEAANTDKQLPGPPAQGYGSTSAGFVQTDEISPWEKVSAYLRGETEEIPETEGIDPKAPAAQISRAEIITEAFHSYTFTGKARKPERRGALWMLASGTSSKAIQRASGWSGYQIREMKTEAMRDLMRAFQWQGKN